MGGGREELEIKASSLVGKMITGISYYDVFEATEDRIWNGRFPTLDLMDYGLDIITTDGAVLGVTWGSEYAEYGLSLYRVPLRSILLAYSEANLSNDERWLPFIGERITTSNITWQHWHSEVGQELYYPQELQIGFSAGTKVFIGASTYLEEQDRLVPASDSIVVTFRRDDAQGLALQ